MSHYETLGVPRDATLDEIRHAYLAKAAQLRPERFAGAPANVVAAVEEAEGVIDEAWRVLGDEVLRADYDRELLEQDDSYRARAESVWAMERELGWPLSPVFGLEPPQVIPGSYRAAAPSAAEGPGALPARSGGVGLAGPVSVPSQRGDVFPLITSLETIANWLAPAAGPRRPSRSPTSVACERAKRSTRSPRPISRSTSSASPRTPPAGTARSSIRTPPRAPPFAGTAGSPSRLFIRSQMPGSA